MSRKPKQFHGSVKLGDPPRNPEGRNGFTSGLQPFHKRCEFLLSKYTLDEIKEHADDLKWLSANVSSWDGICWRRLAAMADGREDERKEVELLIERAEGKALERKQVRFIASMKDLSQEELEALAREGETD